jgi:peptidoglycan/LPS O-acetylase OafA/YrhL
MEQLGKKLGSNFLILRILAAFMVLLGHAPTLRGQPYPWFSLGGVGIHTFGLYVFFAISGYLVTQSLIMSPSHIAYFLKRALRICPGYFVMLFLLLYPLGAILSSDGINGYLNNPSKNIFANNFLFNPVFFLPGVFDKNPIPNVVNGSIWTLPIEIACYLILLFLYWRRIRVISPSKIFIILVTFLMLILIIVVIRSTDYSTNTFKVDPVIVWGTGWLLAAKLSIFFFIGSLLNFIPKRLIRLDFAIIVFIFWVASPPVNAYHDLLTWCVIPYLSIALGILNTRYAKSIERFGDPTYGLYIWAYPIQQFVVQIFDAKINWLSDLIIVSVLSFMMGYLSWHIIENPALSLRRYLKKP